MSEESEWVVESIFGFLSGPVWTVPVLDFVEQNCSVFDDEEENKLSYTEIHQEYKDLVEKLLEGYLQDIGITEEQFQDACKSPFAESHSLQTILQPVLAAEDFNMFKTMMVQKNVELQLQAIQLIQDRNGVLPDCLTNGSDMVANLEQKEMELLTEALRRSKEEYEQEQLTKVTKSCGKILDSSETSKEESSGYLSDVPKNMSFEEIEKSSILSSEHIKACETLKPVQPAVGVLECPLEPPSVKVKEMSNSEAAEAWLEQARKEAGIFSSVTSLTSLEKEQLRQRAEYLKQKRDKLMAKKMESRFKLHKETAEDHEAKASSSASQQEMSEEEMKNLQRRRQLAEKLKKEVINK
ncbi:cilia- and flagella-associated protein 36 isoform X2 [Rhinatrema bivittatum]|uniref:cilia- and flagella-associated protein 36 isoform X2 n=1 Tax=Rhinatrema bivittatum TaxID=194408 RepID=UPI00112C4BE8|nr:cilia- and flagella-associated protein 36 isoform X2 [Rhinatrema bivittatum]